MHKVTIVTTAILFLGLALGLAIFFVPLPPSSGISELAVRLHVGAPIAYAVFHFESVWLLALGLKHFKKELQRAYVFLCIALLILAVAQIQQPLVGIFGFSWWIYSGLIGTPYLAAAILSLLATRTFASLLHLNNRFTSWKSIAFGGLAAVAISQILPVHLNQFYPYEIGFRIAVAETFLQVLFFGLAVYYIWRIQQAMSAFYTTAMSWLFAAMVLVLLAELQYLVLFYIGYENWYAAEGASELPFIISSLVFVRAGYEFWKLGGATIAQRSASAIDVIVFTANLATNPQAIDATLDKLREISSRITPGQALSTSDQVVLAKVYLDLEQYLIKNEQLRTFTRSELRELITRTFPRNVQKDHAFWERLMPA